MFTYIPIVSIIRKGESEDSLTSRPYNILVRHVHHAVHTAHHQYALHYALQRSMLRALRTMWPVSTTCGTMSTSPLSWTGQTAVIKMPYSSLCINRYEIAKVMLQ